MGYKYDNAVNLGQRAGRILAPVVLAWLIPALLFNFFLASSSYESFLFRQLPSDAHYTFEQRWQLSRPLRRYLHYGEPLDRMMFSQRELDHMGDVKHLVDRQRTVTLALLLAVAVMSVFSAVWRSRFLLRLRLAIIIDAVGLGLLAIVGSLLPEQLYEGSHRIFFHNDYWQLDPTRHLLIRLYPPEFFFNFLNGFALALVFTLAVAGLGCWWALRLQKNRQ